MIRRSLGAALWTLVGLLAGFLGALSSLVGTGAGRALLARVSEGALHQVFTGTMEIGDVHGSLLTGLTLSRVRLFDADTTLVAWLPEVNVSYNPFDFAAGRVVLFEFDLRQPVINIVQHPNGRLNIEELLRLGGPDKGPHGPAALILFRNVRITDGTVTLRLQAKRPEPGDSSLEIASDDPNGRLRVRRFEHLDARLSALQVSSPRERGIRIDISRLAMESSDPGVRLVDVAGRLRVVGDSMDVQLARVRLPHSALRDARGTLRWPHGPLLFDLRLRADSATLSDFPFIDRRFAESARSRRSNSSGPCGQRSVPRASRRAECGSRTRVSCTSIESPITRSRPAASATRTAGSELSMASREMSMRMPRSRGEDTCSAESRASRCSKRRTRSRPLGSSLAISRLESPGSGRFACSRRVTVPSVMRTFRNKMRAAGPCGPLSGPPRRNSSSMLSRPFGCCTMLITG